MRTVGFFSDPKIGIVQVPHAFYNHDPMQANLALRQTLPDDQRFFFEAIVPSRPPCGRAEERFQFDEPVWVFSAAGALSTGRTKDLSLSGVGIVADGSLPTIRAYWSWAMRSGRR